MTILRPGCDGDTLPANTLVFRIGRKPNSTPEALEKKRAMEVMFKPLSLEEQSLGQRLSVWVEELTLPDQAWAFMDATRRRPSSHVSASMPYEQFSPPRASGHSTLNGKGLESRWHS